MNHYGQIQSRHKNFYARIPKGSSDLDPITHSWVKRIRLALAGMAQLVGASSLSNLQSGGMQEATSRCFSLPSLLPKSSEKKKPLIIK